MAKSSGRTTAFVPRITFKTALKTVVPACAAAAMAITGCSDDGEVVALAIVGFDAGLDGDASPDAKGDAKGDVDVDAQLNPDIGVIALAVVGFDAAADADADVDGG